MLQSLLCYIELICYIENIYIWISFLELSYNTSAKTHVTQLGWDK